MRKNILLVLVMMIISNKESIKAFPEVIKVKKPTVSFIGKKLHWGAGWQNSYSGDYWWWDDEALQPPFFDSPLGTPDIANWQDITTEIPFAWYGRRCAVKTMPDSFWYYGVWYTKENNDKLYIYYSGWISWDENAEPGNSTPHEEFPQDGIPEAVIAPFWTPLNPAETSGSPAPGDSNAVYYKYDAAARTIIVEWYRVKREGHPEDWYTFEVILVCGGKSLLFDEGCGILYSLHTIEFMYLEHNGTDWGELPEFIVGFENEGNTVRYGVTISSDDYNQEEIIDGRAIRIAYRKIFSYDVAAEFILSPGSSVLRWTPLDPIVVVSNRGIETQDLSLTFKIYKGTQPVYTISHQVFQLNPYDPANPTGKWSDTLICPCWLPEEMGTKYIAELTVEGEKDEYKCNDILKKHIEVRCEDTLSYEWKIDTWMAWGFKHYDWLTGYPLENGGLITGGAGYISSPYKEGKGKWKGVIWEDICGVAPLSTNKRVFEGELKTELQKEWNEWSVPGGIWINTKNPGAFYIGIYSVGPDTTGYWQECALKKYPFPNSCFPFYSYRGARWNHSLNQWNWGGFSGRVYLPVNRVYGHLLFGDYPLAPPPSPVCYNENFHDLKVHDIKVPKGSYVQADSEITPKIGIVNIGRQKEPDEECFYAIFWAVNTKTGKTHKLDSIALTHIGYLGDPTDDPDTLYVSFPPWIPEGQCVASGKAAEYDIYGIVRLPEIGPPNKPKADHCVNNDTLKKTVEALLSHNVGVSKILNPNGWYFPGDTLEFACEVENFGYNDEVNILVCCEIHDQGPVDSSSIEPDTIVYIHQKLIETLGWKGNANQPYKDTVEFEPWVYPEELEGRKILLIYSTQLTGDLCPLDDIKTWRNGDLNIKGKSHKEFTLNIETPFVLPLKIRYVIPVDGFVSINVYDLSGKLVKKVVKKYRKAGIYEVVWDGMDLWGRKVTEGIYFIKMDILSYRIVKKFIILK